MQLKQLKTSILTNSIPTFLIFIEREQALGKQYINSISSTLNKEIRVYSSADAVLYDITSNLKDDYLYCIYNDEKIKKNENYVNELIKTNRNIIVIFEDYDRNSALYKHFEDYFVVFEKLDKYTIVSYLLKKCSEGGVSVSQDKLVQLVEHCDCNLGECLNEIDKIIVLGQTNSNLLMDYMLNDGFSDYRQTNVFRFINKVLDGDMTVFDDIRRLSDSPATVLYNLYVEARRRLCTATNRYDYAQVIKLCSELFNSIVDGSQGGDYMLRYVLWKVMVERQYATH